MRPLSIMVVAGEASGDVNAAALVRALRSGLVAAAAGPTADLQPLRASLEPRFFGAGGPSMAAAGVELAVDLTAHAVFGLWEVVRQLAQFRRLFQQLLTLAVERQPDLLIVVDYAGFNRRFAAAVQAAARRRRGVFSNWSPKVVYFVSPQVWASRSGRAVQLERDLDLLLSIFPFEKEWYARRVPRLRVEFVGNPIADRLHGLPVRGEEGGAVPGRPLVLILPGSRQQEVRRHLPVMVGAAQRIRDRAGARFWMVLPDEDLLPLARSLAPLELFPAPTAADFAADASPSMACSIGNLTQVLPEADLAIASSGTVTVECAWFRVPTVVMYRVAWPTWWIARQLVHVSHVAMPNLLAGERIYPELLQAEATVENVAREGLSLLTDGPRRAAIRSALQRAMGSLGPPGACDRAAAAILELLRPPAR